MAESSKQDCDTVEVLNSTLGIHDNSEPDPANESSSQASSPILTEESDSDDEEGLIPQLRTTEDSDSNGEAGKPKASASSKKKKNQLERLAEKPGKWMNDPENADFSTYDLWASPGRNPRPHTEKKPRHFARYLLACLQRRYPGFAEENINSEQSNFARGILLNLTLRESPERRLNFIKRHCFCYGYKQYVRLNRAVNPLFFDASKTKSWPIHSYLL
ncbi:MAG: hypothetical protein ABW189_08925 [Rickettsiales bacterium]